ncbi:MAG: hypothetical protein ABI425_00165 [Patescibacteria group bacterium]
MPKFTQTFNQMVEEHNELFKQFKTIHDTYRQDRKLFQKEFNEIGKQVMEIIREYEDRLCSGMERGMFGKYSDKVAEKFWDRIKKDYPLIELVGVEISTVQN